MKITHCFVVLIIVSVLAVGCKGRETPDGMPSLVPMTITFSQEGQPLADAEITFFPDGSIENWFAGGTTDASGRVTPMTHGKYRGLAPGKFKVIVLKSEVDPSETVKDPSGGEPHPVFYRLVDPVYTALETTTLELEAAKGTSTASFDLGPAVRVKTKPTFP